jgi:dipeptidase D
MTVVVPPENLEAIANLEPKQLWSHFATLSSIPRPSKQEDQVLTYIKAFAEERNLKWKQDGIGNLVVFHPGCGAGKSAPSVVIQGHVDMVTEKNSDSSHDFEKDPILLRQFIQNENEVWLGARGTTLGADNGIGVAAALALLETPVDDEQTTMPPLEALFTIDEETGLTGAMELNAQDLGLTGKTMLNLDTEEWGELYVGCAGGGESTITVPFTRTTKSTDNLELVAIRVDGLMGGHSGINIHEGRANAILLCAAAAQAALQKTGVSLVSITGGDKHNAIPREAQATFAVSGPQAKQAVEDAAEKCALAAKAEYGTLETNLRIVSQEPNNDACEAPLEQDSASRLISMLLALPHGPLKFSHSMPDLVETSNNVASIAMSGDDATILCSTRSFIGEALESARNRIAAIVSLAGGGAKIEKRVAYPGWNPNMNSNLLKLGKELLSKDGRQPGIKAIHAGLECGLLIEKMGGDVDALSFGPTITGAHSPDERILTDTVPPFFNLVKDMLVELAKK